MDCPQEDPYANRHDPLAPELALAGVAVAAALVGGTASAGPNTGPTTPVCAHFQAKAASAKTEKARAKAAKKAVVVCAPKATKTPKATTTPKPTETVEVGTPEASETPEVEND